MNSLLTTTASSDRRRHCRSHHGLRRKRTRQETLSSTLGVIGTILMIANVQTTVASQPSFSATSTSTNPFRQEPTIHRRSQVEQILALHRGGESVTGDDDHSNENAAGDNMSDEDIDEYIEFLLAYAEDRAVEADNPLFKNAARRRKETKETLSSKMGSVEELSSSESDDLEESQEAQEEPFEETNEDQHEAILIETSSLSVTEEVQTQTRTNKEQATEDNPELSDMEVEQEESVSQEVEGDNLSIVAETDVNNFEEPLIRSDEITTETSHVLGDIQTAKVSGVQEEWVLSSASVEEESPVEYQDTKDEEALADIQATDPKEVGCETSEIQDENAEIIAAMESAKKSVDESVGGENVRSEDILEEIEGLNTAENSSDEIDDEMTDEPVLEETVIMGLEKNENASEDAVAHDDSEDPISLVAGDVNREVTVSHDDSRSSVEQHYPSKETDREVITEKVHVEFESTAVDEQVAVPLDEHVVVQPMDESTSDAIAGHQSVDANDDHDVNGDLSEPQIDNNDAAINGETITAKNSYLKALWQQKSSGRKADNSSNTENTAASQFAEKAAPSVLTITAMQQTLRQNYVSSLRYVRNFWNKPRGPVGDQRGKTSAPFSARPQRDYTKIYEKYLMPAHSVQSETTDQNQPLAEKISRPGYLIQKPWGTMMKLIKQRRQHSVSENVMEEQSDDISEVLHDSLEEPPTDGTQDGSSFLSSLNSKQIVDDVVEEVVKESDLLEMIEEIEMIHAPQESHEMAEGSSFLVSLNSQQITDDAPDEVANNTEASQGTPETTDDVTYAFDFETEVHTLDDLRKDEAVVNGLNDDKKDDEDLAAVMDDDTSDVNDSDIAFDRTDSSPPKEMSVGDGAEIFEEEKEEDQQIEGTVNEVDTHVAESMFLSEIEKMIDSSVLEEVEDDEVEQQDISDDVQGVFEEDFSEDEVVATDDLFTCPPVLSEAEIANVVWKFLIARGLEQWVITLILFLEWFQFYVIAPVYESAEWFVKKVMSKQLSKDSDVLPRWMKTRGGASMDLSENEDGKDDEEALKEEDGGDEAFNDVENPERVTANANPSDDKEICDHIGNEVESSDQVDGSRELNSIGIIERESSDPSGPRIRPNRLYRFLLGYGYVGHVFIMECILFVEWLHVYIPFIPDFVAFVMFEILRLEKPTRLGSGEPAVLRTSGFLGADGTSVRAGKKKKTQTKKEDLRALDQLKRLGDVNQARYHFLSQSFMIRHGLGEYGNGRKNDVDFHIEEEFVFEGAPELVDGEAAESDAEWIVQALAQEEEEDEVELFRSPVETDVGISLGSEGPKVSVGVGFSIGKDPMKRSKSRTSSLSSIARQSASPSKRKKAIGPRISDSQSGVMGRLRAAGASSIMGRNLLGAYPGDLPAPQEAADPRGMIDLAERYGYGDWSDDDDDDVNGDADEESDHDDDTDDDDEFLAPSKRRKKSSTSPKKKRRRKRSSAEIGFGIGLGHSDVPSSSTRKSPRSSSTRRHATISNTPPIRTRQPPKPMELLGDVPDSRSKRILTKKNKSSGSVPSFKQTRPVRPAMSLLDEIKVSKQPEKQD